MFTAAITGTAMAKDTIAAGTARDIIAAGTAKDMCAEKNNLLFYAFFSHQRLKPA